MVTAKRRITNASWVFLYINMLLTIIVDEGKQAYQSGMDTS
jgi:hypothetical protein